MGIICVYEGTTDWIGKILAFSGHEWYEGMAAALRVDRAAIQFSGAFVYM